MKDRKIFKDEKIIRRELKRIKNQIERGDETEILVWVIPNKLACSQRPLRYHQIFGGYNPLPTEARPFVESWVDRIINEGIRSIICLLEERQLDRYYMRGGIGLHRNGLLGYYKSKGINCHHLPMTDYQRPTMEHMKLALKAYDELTKPVLIHCSAAIDRTPPVAAFILRQRV